MFSGAPNGGPEMEGQLKDETLKCVASHKQELASGMQEFSVGGTGQPGRAVPTVTPCKSRSQQCTGSWRQGPQGLAQHGWTVHAVGGGSFWAVGDRAPDPASGDPGSQPSQVRASVAQV